MSETCTPEYLSQIQDELRAAQSFEIHDQHERGRRIMRVMGRVRNDVMTEMNVAPADVCPHCKRSYPIPDEVLQKIESEFRRRIALRP